MGDYARGQLDLDDEDRLPWLEPALDDEDDGDGVSPLRLLGLILLGLILIGALVAGVWWFQNGGTSGDSGAGRLIEAPAGDYKVAANEADARKFAGEGDASFAASEGVAREGRIDPSRVPEAPITQTTPPAERPRAAASTRPSARVSAPVADETAARPAGPVAKAVPAGSMIQLGAYGSESGAKDAWGRLSKRFAYLAPLAMVVEPAEVGGSTVYRLRARAGAQSSTLCGRLKVAGESCLVVN
ncbi:SPOR domain-containing protein [Sphingobium sp. AN641]|uniref:SPOR domain-containing protein n=1 Tax=Sphingobium sp. AN641 TaxID=3133443 RepID=UPI0030C54DFF